MRAAEVIDKYFDARVDLAEHNPSRQQVLAILGSVYIPWKKTNLDFIHDQPEFLKTRLDLAFARLRHPTFVPSINTLASEITSELFEPVTEVVGLAHRLRRNEPAAFICAMDILSGFVTSEHKITVAGLKDAEMKTLERRLLISSMSADARSTQLSNIAESKRINEQDQTGRILLEEYLKVLKDEPSQYRMPYEWSSWQIRELVRFGAQWFNEMYLAIRPSAEQAVSEGISY